MQIGADLARVDQELGDGVEAHISQPCRRPHGLAFAEHVQDQGTGLHGQFVHKIII